MPDHEQVVTAQYDSAADAYLRSRVHMQGQDLLDLGAEAQRHRGAQVLDLGCGPGHVSFAMAPYAGSVTACDLSRDMLAAVSRTAAQRGLDNIRTEQGRADRLPFAAAAFDLVVTRFSGHHWACIQVAAREIHRVLKPGGKLIVVDVVSPRNALLTTWLQTVELLRDVSHVRNRTVAEWQAVFAQECFEAAPVRQWRLALEFASWIERMRTPEVSVAAIHSLWRTAPAEVLEYFAVQPDGSFEVDVAWMEGVRQK